MHDYRIDDVGLSIKAVKFLKRNHIDYVSDLLELTNDDIYQFPGDVLQDVEEMIHLRNSFLTKLGSDTLEPVDRAVTDNRNAVIYQIIPELRYTEYYD